MPRLRQSGRKTGWQSRRAGLAALGLSLILAASACAASPQGTTEGPKAATATSLADFGTLADLEAAAKAEGALNVIALPRDWANYGAILDLFSSRYPEITVTEQSPDVSSAEEIQAAKTNAGLDTAPDTFDLGLAVTLANVDLFAPYKVAT